MSAVSVTYILMADEGLKLGSDVGYPAGVLVSLFLFAYYCFQLIKQKI